ncbi:PREDICTED: protein FAR1-RELATED SEQUENCE 5-like [Ipomoea nil]|uniref:protein FAR1-RELATED SEQUENCE 5-like n=1 Tax=Ipomoea nil TaxID=35883 RepID=UPI000901133F|nr:PREDICTED: protein FAR1-RELATED SEQUENCE 5-like [Ipomoea nil]
MARIVFKRNTAGNYAVRTFEERHAHYLCVESYKPFLKVNRKLDIGHQQFITNCAKVNVGASKSFNIYAELVGGVENVGATQLDFKNYRRDVLAYMHLGDCQMVLSKYLDIKGDYSDMYFEYEANEADQLTRIFWADGYNLVFVPFTGVDNHKKCVTFAAALISREDVDYYCWALRHFKIAMGGAPPIAMTDQDPVMKVAVAKEFPDTRHRYCMWHIMTKVGDKVSHDLARNEEFRKELNVVVWNDTAIADYFEEAWSSVIEKYGLTDNAWFKRMYDERASWVPACFEGVFMGGLLRTTSRSEAENRIFRSNTNKHICLTEFFIRFESTVRKQRITQSELTGASDAQTPPFKTPLPIERRATSLYTLTMFYDVQHEIVAGCFDCRVRSCADGGAVTTYVVEDEHATRYTLTFENATHTTHCQCRLYTRIGLLCRHVFAVLMYEPIENIPPQHVTPRWTRTAVQHAPTEGGQPMSERLTSSSRGDSEESNVVNTFYKCLGLAQGDHQKLHHLGEVLASLETQLCENSDEQVAVARGKRAIMESYCGAPAPESVSVHPPPVVSNKGSGKRLRSAREIAMKEQSKKKRTCKTCGFATGHNSRSCPQK